LQKVHEILIHSHARVQKVQGGVARQKQRAKLA
jgi:hypothetical protein